MLRRCKRLGCSNEFSVRANNPWQAYCCKECAPYGKMKDPEEKRPSRKKTPTKREDEDYLM